MSQQPQDNNTNTAQNPDNINLTLNHINKLLAGVTLAQSRGAYTFDDSAELAETVKLVTKFIKFNNEQAEKNAREQQSQAQAQAQAPPQPQAQPQPQAAPQIPSQFQGPKL